VLGSRGASRARLLRSAESFADAALGQHVVRAVDRPTLHDSDFFMAGVASYDLSDALPAFSPAGRNEDNLFGMTVSTTSRDAVGLCLPVVSPHAPAPAADRGVRARPSFAEHRINDLLRAATFAVGEKIAKSASPLAELGALLAERARTPADGCAWLQANRREVARATSTYLQRLLAEHDNAPDYWARDVEAFAASCNRAATEEHVVAAELGTHEPKRAAELTVEFVRRYAELMVAWPELWAAARDLKT
jgi:hypothetical protein